MWYVTKEKIQAIYEGAWENQGVQIKESAPQNGEKKGFMTIVQLGQGWDLVLCNFTMVPKLVQRADIMLFQTDTNFV